MYVKIMKIKGVDVYKGLWVFVAAFLLFGCSSKKEQALMQNYKEKKTYFKTLQKTERILLSENKITKTLLTATYLHNKNAKMSDKSDESFIVGLYFEDKEVGPLSEIFGLRDKADITKMTTRKDENIITEYYTLTLNGKKAISIEKLALTDARLTGLTFITKWSTYALVKFEHENKKRLKMVFETPLSGKGTVYFSKVAKYVFMKKVF